MAVLRGPLHPGVHRSSSSDGRAMPPRGSVRCRSVHQHQESGGARECAVPPSYVKVVVEVPQGSFVKRRPDGSVDFISPVPSPFNYGSVPDVPAEDGDPLDAVVLGEHLPYGHTGVWRVRGVVRFVDDGVTDNKLICTQQSPPTRHAPTALRVANHSSTSSSSRGSSVPDGLNVVDCFALSTFFTTYAVFKTALNAARGKFGRTAFDGLDFSPPVITK